jgi:hypothetical protein
MFVRYIRHMSFIRHMRFRCGGNRAFRSMIAIARRSTNRGRAAEWVLAPIRRIPRGQATFPTDLMLGRG